MIVIENTKKYIELENGHGHVHGAACASRYVGGVRIDGAKGYLTMLTGLVHHANRAI